MGLVMTMNLNIHPSRGSHGSPEAGACTMECEVLIHGHTWRPVESACDLPPTFCPVIGTYVVHLQDAMPDAARHLLEPLFGRLGENRGTPEDQLVRAEYLVMHAAKPAAAALHSAGIHDHAVAVAAALEGALTIGPQAPPVDPRLAWERTKAVRI